MTYHQVLDDQPVFVVGEKVAARGDEKGITVRVGHTDFFHPGKGIRNYQWNSKNRNLYFIQSVSNAMTPSSEIWQWSFGKGFTKLSIRPDGYYNLSMSRDEQSFSTMIYPKRGKDDCSVLTHSIQTGLNKRVKYRPLNFRPIQIANSDFLLEVDSYSPFARTTNPVTNVYRWSPASNAPTLLKVGGKVVQSAVCIQGTVWVLCQEPRFEWHPWMVKRVQDQITVTQLSPDLSKIIKVIQFDPNVQEPVNRWQDALADPDPFDPSSNPLNKIEDHL